MPNFNPIKIHKSNNYKEYRSIMKAAVDKFYSHNYKAVVVPFAEAEFASLQLISALEIDSPIIQAYMPAHFIFYPKDGSAGLPNHLGIVIRADYHEAPYSYYTQVSEYASADELIRALRHDIIYTFDEDNGNKIIDELDACNFFDLWYDTGCPSINWTIKSLAYRGVKNVVKLFKQLAEERLTLENGRVFNFRHCNITGIVGYRFHNQPMIVQCGLKTF